jgi:hypothetical protein
MVFGPRLPPVTVRSVGKVHQHGDSRSATRTPVRPVRSRSVRTILLLPSPAGHPTIAARFTSPTKNLPSGSFFDLKVCHAVCIVVICICTLRRRIARSPKVSRHHRKNCAWLTNSRVPETDSHASPASVSLRPVRNWKRENLLINISSVVLQCRFIFPLKGTTFVNTPTIVDQVKSVFLQKTRQFVRPLSVSSVPPFSFLRLPKHPNSSFMISLSVMGRVER